MRHANCTGQTTNVPVVALPAPDAVSPSAQFRNVDTVSVRGSYATGWPDGLVGRPRAPAVEQPAAGGGIDGPLRLAPGWRACLAACV